ncbi:MAG: sugar ABC transporter permease [Clostridia bacterium]|nr:sugar ABC transporter permease [Clostridia bacterium]
MKTYNLKNKTKDQIAGILFSVPFIIGFILFFLAPFITYVAMSFSTLKLDDDGNMVFLFEGLGNYYDIIFKQNQFISAFSQSFVRLFIMCPIIIIYSLFIAIILNQPFKGRTIFRAIFFLPVLTSAGVTQMFQTDGLTENAMNAVSGDSSIGQFGMVSITDGLLKIVGDTFSGPISEIINILMDEILTIALSSGVQILIFLAGLQGISGQIYEASKIEGCSDWESFWKITLPMISPLIVVNAIYTIIDILGSSTNGVIEHLYTLAVSVGNYGNSAAMGLVYFIAIFATIGVVYALINRFVYYEDR